ncbi:hypothetical protein HPB52_007800 [Rhipicephalus sanguineus]|uniref:HTH CENPB-type domain-containing protein n=1 Tax=Rhipicephalus sanguineus TaxID=34632 RepID=A0A9D4PJF2_RHISA|nr:hypothetical protein HPB52_007800 [Rhipicephalus sanguineus]
MKLTGDGATDGDMTFHEYALCEQDVPMTGEMTDAEITEVGREFGISKQTVSDLIKNKPKVLEVAAKSTGAGKKNASQGVYPQLEEALLVWPSAMIAKKIPVSGDILKQKAEVFTLQMNRNRGRRLRKRLRKCFRHAGFTLDAETAVSPQVDSVCDELPSADVAFDDLRAAGVSIPAGIIFEGFADADKDLELCAEWTDDEIIRQVTEDSDDSDTENEEPAPTQPTSSELTRTDDTVIGVQRQHDVD